jgi:hypothetical protein
VARKVAEGSTGQAVDESAEDRAELEKILSRVISNLAPLLLARLGCHLARQLSCPSVAHEFAACVGRSRAMFLLIEHAAISKAAVELAHRKPATPVKSTF